VKVAAGRLGGKVPRLVQGVSLSRAADRVEYVVRGAVVMGRDPGGGLERVRGRLDRRRDGKALRMLGRPLDDIYPIDQAWLGHLHEAMGWPWPCPGLARASELYGEVMASFARLGLPRRHAGWCDGGQAFTATAWCLVSHLQPRTVVETGTARGVTSRLVLEALEQQPSGHLYSIDLPTVDSRLHAHMGIAVPPERRGRWTTLVGPSRRLLPRLLDELGTVDLFVHDSLHTGRNTLFEIEQAWSRLTPGGAILVDDVYQSLAFHTFVERARPPVSLVGAQPDGGYRFGVAVAAGRGPGR